MDLPALRAVHPGHRDRRVPPLPPDGRDQALARARPGAPPGRDGGSWPTTSWPGSTRTCCCARASRCGRSRDAPPARGAPGHRQRAPGSAPLRHEHALDDRPPPRGGGGDGSPDHGRGRRRAPGIRLSQRAGTGGRGGGERRARPHRGRPHPGGGGRRPRPDAPPRRGLHRDAQGPLRPVQPAHGPGEREAGRPHPGRGPAAQRAGDGPRPEGGGGRAPALPAARGRRGR